MTRSVTPTSSSSGFIVALCGNNTEGRDCLRTSHHYVYYTGFIYSFRHAMSAEAARNHQRWLEQGRDKLQLALRILRRKGTLRIVRQVFILLTLEPAILESVRQAWNELPPESTHVCDLSLIPSINDRFCLSPPSDEALLATATELAYIFASSIDSLCLSYTTASMTSVFLAACPRLNRLRLAACPLTTRHVQSMVSIKTLRTLVVQNLDLSVLADNFFLEIKSSTVEVLSLPGVSFRPDYEEQVAKTLARDNTLVEFSARVSPSFCHHYCEALSNNVETKLEQLSLLFSNFGGQLDLRGGKGTVRGVDPAIGAKIRNLLKLNVQRKTCPPLFVAIGNAETDEKRKQCLVEAFHAVDIPVVFEYVTANQNNLIELIQRLGRSRKRQREN